MKNRFAKQKAESQLLQAQAELKFFETELDRLTVRAPLDGQVLQLKVHLGEFAPVAATAKGQLPLILIGSEDPEVRIVRLSDGESSELKPTSSVYGVAFSPEGTQVAAGNAAGLDLWSANISGFLPARSAPPDQHLPHPERVWGVAYRPDGTQLATACADGLVRLFSRAADGKLDPSPLELGEHRERVFSVAYSSDGRRVLSASGDGTARLWDLDSQPPRVLQVLEHAGPVTDAAFSPGDDWIVTASEDETARVWSTFDGHERLVLRHGTKVRAAAFSPDSIPAAVGARSIPSASHVITADQDGRIWLWRTSLQVLVDYAKEASRECLDTDQRQRFLAESGSTAGSRYRACKQRDITP